MATDELNQLQKQQIDKFIKQVQVYLDLRVEHAIRVNPTLENAFEELVYHFLYKIRGMLKKGMMYGQNRFQMIDIFFSTDFDKKAQLTDHKAQNTIMRELVDQEETFTEKTGEFREVHDMLTLYSHMNPELKVTMQLIEAWVWWDLQDASDAAVFYDCYSQLRKLTKEGGLSREKVSSYIGNAQKELSLEDYLEINKEDLPKDEITGRLYISMARARNVFARRRLNDEVHRFILKREKHILKFEEAGELLVQCGQRVKAIEKVKQLEKLDERMSDYYRKQLNKDDLDDVTKEMVIEHEETKIREALPKLDQIIEKHVELGKPIEFKSAQLTDMDRILVALRKPLGVPEDFDISDLDKVVHERIDGDEGEGEGEEEEEAPLSF